MKAYAFIQDVRRCARCGDDHEGLGFATFTERPGAGYTHWGMCPKTDEPILMTVEDLSRHGHGGQT